MSSIPKVLRHVRLVLLTEDDAALVVQLRGIEDRNRFLSSIPPDVASQQHWLREYKLREQAAQEYYFKICSHEGIPLGLVRIYDLRPDSFCWGSWIVHPDAPSWAGIESYLAVMEFGFHHMGYPKTHFDVLTENRKVLSFHLKLGSVITGSDESKTYFILTREDYLSARRRYEKFFAD